MDTFKWIPFVSVDPEEIRNVRAQLHLSVQNVAAVGSEFLSESEGDENAVLSWVPGLRRMAGKWVQGDISFRSSISLEEFKIYLVDEKVMTLAEFALQNSNTTQLMIWLEEQIGKFGLQAKNLTMNLPYQLPASVLEKGNPFDINSERNTRELSKYYHNTYLLLREFKDHHGVDTTINIWPHHFDMALDILLKDTGDPETNTQIALGMSPGDDQFENPYFYVNCWPHANTEAFSKLSNHAIWISEEWTGAVMLSKHIRSADKQEEMLRTFYQEASETLIEALTK